MKKQTKTAMKLSVIAMIVSAFMMLAACTETVQKQKIPGATYMGCLLYTSPSPRDA